MTRQEILGCLDALAAATQGELTQAERIECEVAQLADAAVSRLAELVHLRHAVLAASAIAEDVRPERIRRHRPDFSAVRQLA
jgi:hypothetical protein